MPVGGRLFQLKQLVEQSRIEMRTARDELKKRQVYLKDNNLIGSSHHLDIHHGAPLDVRLRSPAIILDLPNEANLDDENVQSILKPIIKKALQKEAKAYLPRRVAYLAEKFDCRYQRVGVSSAGTRWGSCSSLDTITLNISLMNLEPTLIDYVICHELAHTKQRDHSPAFWQIVESFDPDFRTHRRQLKQFSPLSFNSL